MACNTAHLFLDRLEKTLQHKIHSLIDMTVAEAIKTGVKTVGILASPNTIKHGLFSEPLQSAGISLILPTAMEQIVIEKIIRQVIANKSDDACRQQLAKLIERMMDSGSDAVILGCTELSVLNVQIEAINIINPLDIAAKSLVNC